MIPILLLAFPGLLFLLFMGQWIALAMGFIGFLVGLLFLGPQFVPLAGVKAFSALNSFTLTAVPLFVFMGQVIHQSGLGERLYRGLAPWLIRLPGGLLHANIAASAFFAATSGSSLATAATVGSVALPELDKRHYERRLSLGSLAAGGTLGIIIPPSIPLIIYGAFVGESINQLFIGGVVPGILLAILFMGYIAIRARTRSVAGQPSVVLPTRKEMFLGLSGTIPFLVLILFVLGGIYLGIATPTEAAGVGAVFSLILVASYRRLSFESLRLALLATVRITSMILFIYLAATILGAALGNLGVLRTASDAIVEAQVPPIVVLIGIFLLYIVLGMFIDPISIMVLTLNLVYPVVISFGYSGIWLGVVIALLTEIALLTPPVGMNLFIIQSLRADISFSDVMYGSLPFVFLLLAGVALCTAIPQLVLWLPGTMG